MIGDGAEEVAQVDEEDILETYNRRYGEEAPVDREPDNINEDQSV